MFETNKVYEFFRKEVKDVKDSNDVIDYEATAKAQEISDTYARNTTDYMVTTCNYLLEQYTERYESTLKVNYENAKKTWDNFSEEDQEKYTEPTEPMRPQVNIKCITRLLNDITPNIARTVPERIYQFIYSLFQLIRFLSTTNKQ